MIKVYQDKFGMYGNCLSACVASILELPLRDVPWFADPSEKGKSDWYHSLRDFCLKHGFEPVYHYIQREKMDEGITYPLDRYHMISGISPRGYSHAVVGFNGKIVHDPHPDGGGLITISDYCNLYKPGEMHDDVYGNKVSGVLRQEELASAGSTPPA